jgi:hypothetical protein
MGKNKNQTSTGSLELGKRFDPSFLLPNARALKRFEDSKSLPRQREELIPGPNGGNGHRNQNPNGVRLLVIVKMPQRKEGLLIIFIARNCVSVRYQA